MLLCSAQFNMLVSYTYRSDDAEAAEEDEMGAGAVRAQGQAAMSRGPEMKNFSFYTVVDLGVIVPRDEGRAEASEA